MNATEERRALKEKVALLEAALREARADLDASRRAHRQTMAHAVNMAGLLGGSRAEAREYLSTLARQVGSRRRGAA